MMKATRRQGVVTATKSAKQRVNLRIDVEAYERLLIHAIKSKQEPGEIVTALIDAHLRTWRVQQNPSARVMSSGSVEPDGPVEPPSEIAA
jgi:hypothetical protein